MPEFPYGYTITVHRTEVTGEDADGNDVLGEVDYTVDGVAVWPRTTVELVQGQSTTIIGKDVLIPPDLDFELTSVDEITIFGQRFTIDGEPGRYTSPLDGFDAGTLAHLTRVTG